MIDTAQAAADKSLYDAVKANRDANTAKVAILKEDLSKLLSSETLTKVTSLIEGMIIVQTINHLALLPEAFPGKKMLAASLAGLGKETPSPTT